MESNTVRDLPCNHTYRHEQRVKVIHRGVFSTLIPVTGQIATMTREVTVSRDPDPCDGTVLCNPDPSDGTVTSRGGSDTKTQLHPWML